MQALYPVIIKQSAPEPAFPNGVFEVEVPDLDIATFGLTLLECYNNAEDAINLALSSYQTDRVPAPKASDIRTIKAEPGTIVTLVKANTRVYKRKYRKIFKK